MTKPVSSAAKFVAALLLSAALFVQVPFSNASAASAQANNAGEYAVFLEDKYDITVDATSTKGEYIQYVANVLQAAAPQEQVAFTDLDANDDTYASAAALYNKGILSSTSVGANEQLKPYVATLIALRASNLKELALTYPQAKVDAAFKQLGISANSFNTATAQEIAAAVDTGLIPAEFYAEFAAKAPASEELVNTLLAKVLTFNGSYKQYIGNVSDADIASKFYTAFKTSNIIQIPSLQQFVDSALKGDVITGYNMKDDRYDANFVPALTITYGHSNVKHAIQLLGLLQSENIDAKVQFEPKTSAFVHRKEWGEPVIDENNQSVLTENGNYIHYSKEYDLKLEFSNVEDKTAFEAIILQYAKKNADDQQGLIAGSWWQPLFYTLEDVTSEGYKQIANNKIVDGHYYVQTFSLVDDAAKVQEGFAKLDPKVEVESYNFWTNEAFFNYLNGEGL